MRPNKGGGKDRLRRDFSAGVCAEACGTTVLATETSHGAGPGDNRGKGHQSTTPTVLFVLHEVLNQRKARAGDLGVLLALGPGFAAEAALLEW